MWGYHDKHDWYQDVCISKCLTTTSVLLTHLDTISTFINNRTYPKIHQGMAHTISRFLKKLHISCPRTALAIKLQYVQNLLQLFVCPLSICYLAGIIFFIFILLFLPTSADLTICPIICKRCLKNILNIYHIQYINLFPKLRLILGILITPIALKMVKFSCGICQKNSCH